MTPYRPLRLGLAGIDRMKRTAAYRWYTQ